MVTDIISKTRMILICNHWDLDYLSLEELEARLVEPNIETTIVRKKKEF